MRTLVAPLFEIPAQMCTLKGCFARPFSFGCSHLRRKQSFACFSRWTEHSSVKITSSNCSLSSKQFKLNSSRLARVWVGSTSCRFAPTWASVSVFSLCCLRSQRRAVPEALVPWARHSSPFQHQFFSKLQSPKSLVLNVVTYEWWQYHIAHSHNVLVSHQDVISWNPTTINNGQKGLLLWFKGVTCKINSCKHLT